jgi:serine/threonine-protein kinase HipA
MTSASTREIEVCADWIGLSGPRTLGTLHATPARGRELFAFEYAPSWLEHGDGRALDPNLVIARGRQYTRPGHDNFGVFLDSCPDRWGRVLMRRREARDARRAGRPERTLLESDYLLGVFDRHRMGALRFRTAPGGAFVDHTPGRAAPPWTSLRALEHATRGLERDDAEDDPAYDEWLALLLAPGASLGGARPKADVIDPAGRLWIAKFPSIADTHDVGAWEHVVHVLAQAAGIDVPEARVEQFASKQHTFLVRRFDRTQSEQRVHFASALTLLGRKDGDDGSSVASYLELATLIERHGAHPARDLEQLWRRIAFSVCVSNVDDHLRNHGFILGDEGWSLSPAYDINPIAGGDGLRLNISETDNAQDLDLVREVAPYLRIKRSRVEPLLAEIRAAAGRWREVATDVGLSRAAQDRMARAFRLADAR